MRCKNCGFDNMDGANFCIQCGTRLEQEPEPSQTEDELLPAQLPQEDLIVYEEQDVLSPDSLEEWNAGADSIEDETGMDNAAVPEETDMDDLSQETSDGPASLDTVSDIIEALQQGNDEIKADLVDEDAEDEKAAEEESALDQALDDLDFAALQANPAEEALQADSNDNEAKWYYMDGDKPVGPFSVSEILERIHDGVVDRHTWVWTKGLPDWIRLSQSQIFSAEVSSQNTAGTVSSSGFMNTGTSSSAAASSSQSSFSAWTGTAAASQTSSAYQNAASSSSSSFENSSQSYNNASAASAQWFCVQDSRSTGPYSPEVIGQMLKNKTINSNTYVWKEGMSDWEYLRNTELASLIPAGSAPYWNQNSHQGVHSAGHPLYGSVTNKSILLYVLLCILTCGIWNLIWMYQIAKDINELAIAQNKPKGCDPILAVILSLMTCNLYSIYYFYKEGNTIAQLDYPGYRIENQAILLAILGAFIPLASLAILQDQINSVLRYGG